MQESKPRAHIIVHSQIGSRKCKADDNFCNQIIMSDEGEFHLNGAQKTQESAIMYWSDQCAPKRVTVWETPYLLYYESWNSVIRWLR